MYYITAVYYKNCDRYYRVSSLSGKTFYIKGNILNKYYLGDRYVK